MTRSTTYYFISSLVFLILWLLPACQTKKTKPTSQQPDLQLYIDSLTSTLNAIKKTSIIPGFGIIIVKDESIVFNQGFGYADIKKQTPFSPKTVHIIASISKTFIGFSIMKLVEMGKLDLDEKVNDILPYKVVNPNFPDFPITVRQLVTHTAGLSDEFDPEEVGEAEVILMEELTYEDERIQKIMEEDLSYYKLGKYITLAECVQKYLDKNGKWYTPANFSTYPPGTKYAYSNLGSELAAVIVEIKSGLTFSEFTKEHIFQPLGMDKTAWFHEEVDTTLLSKIYRPDDWDNPTVAIEHPKYFYVGYSAGELKSNMEDMTKYLMEMMKGYHGKGKLLTATSYKTLFAPQLTDSFYDEERDDSPISDEYNVGVFWAISPIGLRLHNGGSIGVYSFLYFNPEKNSGAFGFCNLPDASFGSIRDAVFEYETKMFKESQ